MSFHQSVTLGSQFVPSIPGIVILELQHIGYMRSVLDVKRSPKPALFDSRKVRVKHRIHNPKPQSPKKNSQSRTSNHLSQSVVTQIHPRIHSEQSQSPRQKNHSKLVLRVPEPNPFIRHEGEVDSKEEHVLRVARRPSMQITQAQETMSFFIWEET